MRILFLACTVGAIAIFATAAARANQTGLGCGSASSAINQYCESIPSANGRGSQTPGTLAPALGTSLPARAVGTYRRLPTAERKRARVLLSLPAPMARVPLSASIVHKSSWSFPLGVLIAILAIAATGLAAAILRRRQRSG